MFIVSIVIIIVVLVIIVVIIVVFYFIIFNNAPHGLPRQPEDRSHTTRASIYTPCAGRPGALQHHSVPRRVVWFRALGF